RYQVQVVRLAQAHRLASERRFAQDETIGVSGQFEIAFDGKNAVITVDSGDTLATLVQKINDADVGVTAKVIDGRLVLEANAMNKEIQLTDLSRGTVLLNLDIRQVQAYQDAEFIVDGITINRDINTISDVIAGVTLTLKATGTVSIEVQHDVNLVIERVKAFVDQYNSVQNFIKEKTGDGGVLQGDVLLGRIQFQLRQLATARVRQLATARVDGAPEPSPEPYNQLAMIGI